MSPSKKDDHVNPHRPRGQTLAIVTLGCPKNTVDSEHMAALLARNGWQLAGDPAIADLIVVNTCGFIDAAKEESIDTILELARHKELGRCRGLYVVGCLIQGFREELEKELPEVDGFLGTGDFSRIIELVGPGSSGPGELRPAETLRLSLPRDGWAYLRIAEGCDHLCTFCSIPRLRGAFHSRFSEEIVAEGELLVGQGAVELCLIAQDSTSYGLDLFGERRLGWLLEQVGRIEGLRWLRFLYGHPLGLDTYLVDVLASGPPVVPYLDLPLQHADPGVLRAMGRGSDGNRLKRQIERLRQAIPELSLRTTMIVGFPGEDEHAFESLLDFVAEVRFDRLGAFVYSPQEQTPAATLGPAVDPGLAEERLERLMLAQREISLEKHRALVGGEADVLVDGLADEEGERVFVPGRLPGQAPEIDGGVRVFLDVPRRAARRDCQEVEKEGAELEAPAPGEIVRVRITGAEPYDLDAVLLGYP